MLLRRNAALLVLLVSSANVANAQGRGGVVPSFTNASIVECSRYDSPRAGCFRVFVSVRAEGEPVSISWLSGNQGSANNMRSTYAYLTNGARCASRMGGDLPQVTTWSNGAYTMRDEAPVVTKDRPYRFFITFLCDQPIGLSDKANLQLGLFVSTGRADPGGGGMAAREIQLVSADLDFGGPRAATSPSQTQSPASTPDPARPVLGFRVAVVQDGAYIREVIPGSAAERAGLIPGMVISSLNGTSLKGKDAASLDRILATAPNEVVLEIIGKGQVRLRKAPIIY